MTFETKIMLCNHCWDLKVFDLSKKGCENDYVVVERTVDENILSNFPTRNFFFFLSGIHKN